MTIWIDPPRPLNVMAGEPLGLHVASGPAAAFPFCYGRRQALLFETAPPMTGEGNISADAHKV